MKEVTGQLVIDFSPAYRKNETTSKEADKKITMSGLKRTQCFRIFSVIINGCNGGTRQEIARIGNINPAVVCRRLSTLRDNGFLKEGEIRKCKVTGNRVKTWWIK